MYGLVHSAAIFTPDLATGAYTVLVMGELACRLTLVSPEEGRDAHDRAELAAMRRLLWGTDAVLPENCQVQIDGTTWNIVAGSLALVTGIAGRPIYRRADLVRAL